MKKILILMAKFGGGHESIAFGIKEALEKYAPNTYQIVVEDGFPKIFTDHQAYGSIPFIAEKSYKMTNYESISKILHTTVTMLIGRHLKKIILKHLPDLIISNHALLTSEVKGVLEKIKKRIIFTVYFADAICPHQLWFSEKNADLYFAPTHECFDYALKQKIAKEKLIYTGWILREKYYSLPISIKEQKKNLGLKENKFLVVLGGGGEGVGKIEEIADMLLSNKYFLENGQLVVVCGTNHKLLIKLQKKQRHMGDILNSFGFIYNLADYKKAADIIVSKAGPNEIFESILLEKPFFAHNYLWAHEIDNMKWIKTNKIGYANLHSRKISEHIIKFMKNPVCEEKIMANIKRIKKDHIYAPQILTEEIKTILK